MIAIRPAKIVCNAPVFLLCVCVCVRVPFPETVSAKIFSASTHARCLLLPL